MKNVINNVKNNNVNQANYNLSITLLNTDSLVNYVNYKIYTNYKINAQYNVSKEVIGRPPPP